MGLREKVIVLLIADAFYKTVYSLSTPQSLNEDPFEKYINKLKNSKSRYSSKYEAGSNLQNQRFQNEFRKQIMCKTYSFPEVDYPSDTSPKVPNHVPNTEYDSFGKSSIDMFNDSVFLNNLRKEKRRKRKNKPTEQFYTRDDQPLAIVNDMGLFPEVQYPLTASETWIPSYWNPLYTNKEDAYTMRDDSISQSKHLKNNNFETFLQSPVKRHKGSWKAEDKITKTNFVKNVTPVKNDNILDKVIPRKKLSDNETMTINKTPKLKKSKKTPKQPAITKKKLSDSSPIIIADSPVKPVDKIDHKPLLSDGKNEGFNESQLCISLPNNDTFESLITVKPKDNLKPPAIKQSNAKSSDLEEAISETLLSDTDIYDKTKIISNTTVIDDSKNRILEVPVKKTAGSETFVKVVPNSISVISEPIVTEALADNQRVIILNSSDSQRLVDDMREIVRLLLIWNSQIDEPNGKKIATKTNQDTSRKVNSTVVDDTNSSKMIYKSKTEIMVDNDKLIEKSTATDSKEILNSTTDSTLTTPHKPTTNKYYNENNLIFGGILNENFTVEPDEANEKISDEKYFESVAFAKPLFVSLFDSIEETTKPTKNNSFKTINDISEYYSSMEDLQPALDPSTDEMFNLNKKDDLRQLTSNYSLNEDILTETSSSSEFPSTISNIVSSLAEKNLSEFPFETNYEPNEILYSNENDTILISGKHVPPDEKKSYNNVCLVTDDTYYKNQCYLVEEPDYLHSTSNLTDVTTDKQPLSSVLEPIDSLLSDLIMGHLSNYSLETQDYTTSSPGVSNTDSLLFDDEIPDFTDYTLSPEEDTTTDFVDKTFFNNTSYYNSNFKPFEESLYNSTLNTETTSEIIVNNSSIGHEITTQPLFYPQLSDFMLKENDLSIESTTPYSVDPSSSENEIAFKYPYDNSLQTFLNLSNTSNTDIDLAELDSFKSNEFILVSDYFDSVFENYNETDTADRDILHIIPDKVATGEIFYKLGDKLTINKSDNDKSNGTATDTTDKARFLVSIEDITEEAITNTVLLDDPGLYTTAVITPLDELHLISDTAVFDNFLDELNSDVPIKFVDENVIDKIEVDTSK